jgi:hypothetical protein
MDEHRTWPQQALSIIYKVRTIIGIIQTATVPLNVSSPTKGFLLQSPGSLLSFWTVPKRLQALIL